MNNETEQPDAIDRITIEKRTMLALEKIAMALEKLNLEQYMARTRILANQYEFSKSFDTRLDKMFSDITPPRYDETFEEGMGILNEE